MQRKEKTEMNIEIAHSNGRFYLYSAALICAFISAVILAGVAHISMQSKRELLQSQLGEVRGELEHRIARYIAPIIALRSFIIENGGKFEATRFDQYATSLHDALPGLMAAQVAPDGIVQFTTRRERNSAALGHDLFKDPKRREQAYQAIRQNRTILAGPVTLRQGGNAVIARMPIFLPNTVSRTGITDFFGFSTALIDADILLKGIDKSIPNFAIRGKHGRGVDGEQFVGPDGVFDAPHLALDLTIPNGKWVIAVPEPGWGTAWPNLVFTAAVCLLVSWAIVILARKRQLAVASILRERRRLEFVARIGALGFIELRPGRDRFISPMAREILNIASGEDADNLPPEAERQLTTMCQKLESSPEEKTMLECEIDLGRKSDGTPAVAEFLGVRDSELGRIIAIRDISEAVRRRENEMVTAKLVSIGQLAAGIAHELNTPLQFIGGNLEFCRTVISDLGETIENLSASDEIDADLAEEIQHELPKAIAESLDGTQHMSRIVSAIKDYAAPDRSDSAGPVDIGEVIRKSLVLTIGSHKHTAEVSLDLPELPAMAWGDANDYSQVLINTIGNAFDAIDEGESSRGDEKGHIEIRVSEKPNHYLVSINDNGIGISPELARRAFDLFFTTKPVGKGTGQGLAISLSIVRKYGGDMTIRPGETGGTTVSISLPKEPKAALERPAA
jgi:signal transduction histidine kinase